MKRYDAIVIGLGAHGGATAHEFAKRGLHVLGLDGLRVPHEQGSSHGESRIIREAYMEDPAYVPFVQRAYELWGQLERATGRRLVVKTGGLMMGTPGSATFGGAKRSAELHGLPHEVLSSAEVQSRFPAFNVEDRTSALLEPRAGALLLPATLESQLSEARRLGAELRFDEPAVSWSANESGVTVGTVRGNYDADRLVIAAGAWMPRLVPGLGLPLRVERQVMFWFQPTRHPERFLPGRFPVFIWEWREGRTVYGFPDLGSGVKIGVHHDGVQFDPDRPDRVTTTEDEEAIGEDVVRCFPDLGARPIRSKMCLYTNTPDTTFVLDRHPRHDRVVVVSCCSGHGFKFAPAVGEAAVRLALGERSGVDLSLFRISRTRGPAD